MLGIITHLPPSFPEKDWLGTQQAIPSHVRWLANFVFGSFVLSQAAIRLMQGINIELCDHDLASSNSGYFTFILYCHRQTRALWPWFNIFKFWLFHFHLALSQTDKSWESTAQSVRTLSILYCNIFGQRCTPPPLFFLPSYLLLVCLLLVQFSDFFLFLPQWYSSKNPSVLIMWMLIWKFMLNLKVFLLRQKYFFLSGLWDVWSLHCLVPWDCHSHNPWPSLFLSSVGFCGWPVNFANGESRDFAFLRDLLIIYLWDVWLSKLLRHIAVIKAIMIKVFFPFRAMGCFVIALSCSLGLPFTQLKISYHSADILILCIHHINTKSYGERSFSYTALTLRNTLPKDKKNSQSISSFRSALKTHLFTT